MTLKSREDPHTVVFIQLALVLSFLRSAFRLDTRGHDQAWYVFHWDSRSMKTIIPGICHLALINNYLYSCGEEDRQQPTEYPHLNRPSHETNAVEIIERT